MAESSYISLSPKGKVTILLKRDEDSIVAFLVKNMTKDPLVCVLSSNQKGLYFVKPTRFILRADESKLVSVRCEKNVVNGLMDADLPTNNKLQITSYTVGDNLYKMIVNSEGKSEKEKIAKYVSCYVSN